MLISAHRKFGRIKVPNMSDDIAIRVSFSPEVPSALSKKLKYDLLNLPTKLILIAIDTPLVTIEDPTANKANTNLHRRRPLSGPFSLSTENGPTWRNFVIPKEPVMMEMAYVVKNQGAPPKPLKTAHLLGSGLSSQLRV